MVTLRLKANVGTSSYTSSVSGGMILLDGGETVVDYYDDHALTLTSSDRTVQYGDWWAESATVTISQLDLTNRKATIHISATLFDAEEAYVNGQGNDNLIMSNLNIHLENVTLQ